MHDTDKVEGTGLDFSVGPHLQIFLPTPLAEPMPFFLGVSGPPLLFSVLMKSGW